MDSGAYLKTLLAGIFTLLAALAAFCYVVDPFWYNRKVSIPGFNAIKPEFKRYERHVKPQIVRRERPAALVFGNSYAEIGFDPLHPALTPPDRHERGYNFGLAGADWERIYCSARFTLDHAAPKRVIIGFQPGHPLRAVDCGVLLAEMEHLPVAALLLSGKAIKSSLRTVKGQRKTPTHTAEGLFYYTRFEVEEVERRFRADFARYLGNLKPDAPCLLKPRAVVVPPPFDPAEVNGVPADLAGLHDLVVRLARAGVETRLVAYPVHALRAEADIACGFANLRWEALLAITRTVRQADPEGRRVEVWDFQGYDPDLLEPIRDNQTRLWQDSGHFNHEFGNRLLDRMFGLGEEDFGNRIEPAAVPALRAAFFRERAAFLESHPGFMDEFAALIESFRKTP
ncbi:MULTISPECIES: hypothetical protein [Methylococcus]|uniref:SGNH/GDSL hydrolase family protein n=1 Tax=Methylococcus capsulatus TaxID=414 RepID=A0ABZ2F8F2_METCP|nr:MULTISPECIES: hypothetical protein [Methylococcus]MDF9393250.1 hypothetical protein [Methylococcus capsulatus]